MSVSHSLLPSLLQGTVTAFVVSCFFCVCTSQRTNWAHLKVKSISCCYFKEIFILNKIEGKVLMWSHISVLYLILHYSYYLFLFVDVDVVGEQLKKSVWPHLTDTTKSLDFISKNVLLLSANNSTITFFSPILFMGISNRKTRSAYFVFR